MTKISEQFESQRDAESAARNLVSTHREKFYVLRMFKTIPETFEVVNEAGIAPYRGKGICKIAGEYTVGSHD